MDSPHRRGGEGLAVGGLEGRLVGSALGEVVGAQVDQHRVGDEASEVPGRSVSMRQRIEVGHGAVGLDRDLGPRLPPQPHQCAERFAQAGLCAPELLRVQMIALERGLDIGEFTLDAMSVAEALAAAGGWV